MSRTGEIALWTLLAVVAAAASWTGYGIGSQLAQPPQQRVIIIVHTAPINVTCVPAAACSITRGDTS